MTNWEYARLEYRAAGTLGTDRFMDWTATFHHPGGLLRWGTDERFDDLQHLNRAGAAGWQAYDRAVDPRQGRAAPAEQRHLLDAASGPVNSRRG